MTRSICASPYRCRSRSARALRCWRSRKRERSKVLGKHLHGKSLLVRKSFGQPFLHILGGWKITGHGIENHYPLRRRRAGGVGCLDRRSHARKEQDGETQRKRDQAEGAEVENIPVHCPHGFFLCCVKRDDTQWYCILRDMDAKNGKWSGTRRLRFKRTFFKELRWHGVACILAPNTTAKGNQDSSEFSGCCELTAGFLLFDLFQTLAAGALAPEQ